MIKNRHELLFIYDVTDANANGDPLDENKPRIDEETGINIVTDVRLKRTIRDYLYSYKGFDGSGGRDIFVREVEAEKGLKDAKARARDFNEDVDQILKTAIDIRLFGGVIPLKSKKDRKKDKEEDKDNSITFTGPVQFNMGRSLNRVKMIHIKGTGAFASTEGKSNKTFREEYVTAYSLIAFHGIVNENAAKDTKLTDEDIGLLYEAMWNGTKNLITRSKMGHMPRLLLNVKYKPEQNFFIGDLQKRVKLYAGDEEKIRGLGDFSLDITELVQEFKLHGDKIKKILYTCDKKLKLLCNGSETELSKLSGIVFEEKPF